MVCVDNAGYPGSLLVRKIYRVIADEPAAKEGMIRVVDESGEDYLYDEARFVTVQLARDAEQAVLNAE